MPFPVWKRAMVASEPAYTTFGKVQVLIDIPGTPGMSGAPVYHGELGVSVPKHDAELLQAANRGEISALEALRGVAPSWHSSMALTLVGVYVGSQGNPVLDKLSLGRMFHRSLIDKLVQSGERGMNPFPPEQYC